MFGISHKQNKTWLHSNGEAHAQMHVSITQNVSSIASSSQERHEVVGRRVLLSSASHVEPRAEAAVSRRLLLFVEFDSLRRCGWPSACACNRPHRFGVKLRGDAAADHQEGCSGCHQQRGQRDPERRCAVARRRFSAETIQRYSRRRLEDHAHRPMQGGCAAQVDVLQPVPVALAGGDVEVIVAVGCALRAAGRRGGRTWLPWTVASKAARFTANGVPISKM